MTTALRASTDAGRAINQQEAGWPDTQLSEAEARAGALGLVRRNIEGELVVAYPLREADLRAAYLESPGA